MSVLNKTSCVYYRYVKTTRRRGRTTLLTHDEQICEFYLQTESSLLLISPYRANVSSGVRHRKSVGRYCENESTIQHGDTVEVVGELTVFDDVHWQGSYRAAKQRDGLMAPSKGKIEIRKIEAA